MRQKSASELLNATTSTTSAEELQNGNAEGSPIMAPQSSSQSTSVGARPRIAALIVALSCHTLVAPFINAKIKMEKMH